MAYGARAGFGRTSAPEDAGSVFIHDDTDPRAAVIHVFGEATFADAAAFESAIAGSVRIGKLVAIDMSECAYMDCATIGVLVRAAKSLGDQLRLIIPRGSQGHRMLELVGLAHVLHVFDTFESAVAPIVTASRRLRSV